MNVGDSVFEVETDWDEPVTARIQSWMVINVCGNGDLILSGTVFCNGATTVVRRANPRGLYRAHAEALAHSERVRGGGGR